MDHWLSFEIIKLFLPFTIWKSTNFAQGLWPLCHPSVHKIMGAPSFSRGRAQEFWGSEIWGYRKGRRTANCSVYPSPPTLPTTIHLETLTLTNGGMVLIFEHWSKTIYFLICVVDLLQVSYHRSWNPAGLWEGTFFNCCCVIFSDLC